MYLYVFPLDIRERLDFKRSEVKKKLASYLLCAVRFNDDRLFTSSFSLISIGNLNRWIRHLILACTCGKSHADSPRNSTSTSSKSSISTFPLVISSSHRSLVTGICNPRAVRTTERHPAATARAGKKFARR